MLQWGNNDDCLHAPWSLPWSSWYDQVEVYYFLTCLLPRRTCLGEPFPSQKRSIQAWEGFCFLFYEIIGRVESRTRTLFCKVTLLPCINHQSIISILKTPKSKVWQRRCWGTEEINKSLMVGASWNEVGFRNDLNMFSDFVSLEWFGSLFQSLGCFTKKALSAKVVRLVLDTTKFGEHELIDRRCLRLAHDRCH